MKVLLKVFFLKNHQVTLFCRLGDNVSHCKKLVNDKHRGNYNLKSEQTSPPAAWLAASSDVLSLEEPLRLLFFNIKPLYSVFELLLKGCFVLERRELLLFIFVLVENPKAKLVTLAAAWLTAPPDVLLPEERNNIIYSIFLSKYYCL